jgi:hypothetical protein
MGQELEKVKSGYAVLDDYDRQKVREFIQEFEAKSGFEKKAINERFGKEIRNKSLGPTSSANCPCCGA